MRVVTAKVITMQAAATEIEMRAVLPVNLMKTVIPMGLVVGKVTEMRVVVS
jgi:hypothetical protein